MQPTTKLCRYLAFAWVPVAIVGVLAVGHPGWMAAAAVSAVFVPLALVVIGTVLDDQAPHRPATEVGRLRPLPARSV